MRWWAAAPIRVRLTAWYTVALSLMLVVYAAATFFAVRHEFLELLDDQLKDDHEAAEGRLAAMPDGRLTWARDPDPDADLDADRGSDVWSAAGEHMLSSGVSIGLPSATLAAATAAPQHSSIDVGGHNWRILAGPATVNGRTVVLSVSRSEERLRAELREVLTVLGLGLPVIVGLAGFGGYVLARRALAPIAQLTSAGRRLTADNLHERLVVPNQHDEIGRLAAVINDAVARLESSFDRLRRFTADASHELRTPLSVIRGIGEMGLAETRTPAEYKEAIGSMLEEVDRLTSLVDTLLRLSHGDAGTVRLARELLDLGQLARDVVSSLAMLAEERGQTIRINVAGEVRVTADRLVLREAITNVLDNAIKYSRQAAIIDVGVRREDRQALVTVTDQGPGIPTEQRERIFDRFFRLDEGRSRSAGGMGLGLAIAKWAVEANGGRISVDGGVGGGSIFFLRLPCPEGPLTTPHENASHSREGHL